MTVRNTVKALARGLALVAVLPLLASFAVRALVLGRDRALHGSTQMLALVPGLIGQYLRRAFLSRTIEACHPTAVIEFGTLLSRVGARLDKHAYVGPRCHLGLVHIERDVLIAAGVHLPSGSKTHRIDDLSIPIRDQMSDERLVRIGAGSWIGEGAIVMADVGSDTVVGAGAVVTRPLPARCVAAGVPARVLRLRDSRPSVAV
jgi:acetyltransferase-like isoleucine patch superfamily enzyme